MSPEQAKFDPQITARRQWRVAGQVQGVGFRPFVYRLAHEHHLTGFVRNDTSGVLIEAQGQTAQLESFEHVLRDQPPQLAAIDQISSTPLPPVGQETEFTIISSASGVDVDAEITIDSAVCPDCLRELFDPADRRFGYGLINCTNCGPRFTIIQRIPYDRPNTTMAYFGMCPDCHREYEQPVDRRFHAQPVACHQCGPRVGLVQPNGTPIKGDAIGLAARRLLQGQILAIKGLGGFHLAVRADSATAVQRLRQLKNRDNKPFAVMVTSLDEARALVDLSESAAALMASPRCPIILARRKANAAIAPAVAPGNSRLGVMLPYTPIQQLLFAQLVTQHAPLPLVMTSANISDEPLVIDNTEAINRLTGLCDAILWHDRPIERPVDDSVLIDMPDAPLPVRRARGYVPGSLPLPMGGDLPGLCVGGELKNTIAVVRNGRAILSHHLGDLTHPQTYAAFRRAIRDMQQLFGVKPQWIAHDLHPVYLSTVAAREIAAESGVPLVSVQHHHAHAAAVMAEHGKTGPCLAVVCDGVGYGTDGTMWGGELLLADLRGYRRVAHLKPLLLPGGDAAAKDCRRCGLALLQQAYPADFQEHPVAAKLFPQPQERLFLANMLRRNVQCVPSSGAGRVFDGVAALLGLCSHNSYEAEAAMRLESLAGDAPLDSERRLATIAGDDCAVIDLAPVIRLLLQEQEEGRGPAELSARFHDQFALAWEAAIMDAAKRFSLNCVVLSGGVFLNERLTSVLGRRLRRWGFVVLRHRLVPPNDGGLSLGQAAVASARMAAG